MADYGEEVVMKSWLSVVVAAVAVAQIHHHHFVVIVVVVVQSLSFHCVALVASYYSSRHRLGQYRFTSTRNFGAATNDDDDDDNNNDVGLCCPLCGCLSSPGEWLPSPFVHQCH